MIKHPEDPDSGPDIFPEDPGPAPLGPDEEPWYINRHAILLRPRRPFVDWFNRIEKSRGNPKTTLPDARESPIAFLIPSFMFHAAAWQWVRENYGLMFESSLDEWVLDRDLWPPDLSWERFEKWFDLELIDGLIDLVDDELKLDFWDDLDDLDELDELYDLYDLDEPDELDDLGPITTREIVLEVVDNQLDAEEPPIVRETLDRLMAAGRPREEARDMIADVLGEEMFEMVRDNRPHDPDRYRRRLEGLE